jgi:hypothetical protein
MVSDACAGFRGQEVAGRCLEELQHRRVLERGGVRHVDDDRGARDGLRQSVAGEHVDARVGRRRDGLTAVLVELGHELRSDEPASADDDDPHVTPFACLSAPSKTAQRRPP